MRNLGGGRKNASIPIPPGYQQHIYVILMAIYSVWFYARALKSTYMGMFSINSEGSVWGGRRAIKY